jgi:acyl-CoA synthetase (NDP forming)/GNAT superfamily N-acetyltransferase
MGHYPPHWEADVVAADGGTVHLRPIEPSDADAIVAFHEGLSPRTRYLRYFSAYPRIPARDLIRFTTVDHHYRVGLIMLLGGQIIAVGRYEGQPGSTEAEVAFVVADAHQGRGLGSVLLEHLAAAARESGITRFTALVLAENQQMLRVFRDAGYQSTRAYDGGEISLAFEIRETALTDSVQREREQHAEARSIQRLLQPSSVAVIGASNDEAKVGHAVFRNLLSGVFRGPIYPVNPDAREVAGVRAYPSIADVPDVVELAVIAVPAASVPGVVTQCAERGVRGLVLLSGGFGERGDEQQREAGAQAQRDIVTAARANGMRVIGPNCLGIANTDPAVALNASLAPIAPLRGRAGFFCQSGALGVAVLGEAARRGLGVSSFVSAGNRADVSGNDLLQYWESDEATDVALLYLESFGNPRKFARLARRLGRSKPIVAVKSGHGSTVAGLATSTVEMPPESVQALFEASGVIRVDTLGDLFDVALALMSQPLPAGDRVAVVGNSSALGVLASDACAAEQLQATLIVDVGPDASADELGAALAQALADESVDAAVALFVPSLPVPPSVGERYAVALRSASATADKPVLSTFLGFEGVPGALAAPGPGAPSRGSIPSYPTPERAVRALAKTVRYAHWRTRPAGKLPDLGGTNVADARDLVIAALAGSPSGRELDRDEAANLLGCYGVDVVGELAVVGLDEALRAAAALAAPVAIKVPGAVRLHLPDATAIKEAWASLGLAADAPAAVQVMAPRGVDVVLDVRADSSFGAIVAFGVGGVATELLGDRAYAAVPLTTADADQLIGAPKAAPLLSGYGGAEPADLGALADLALRLSALADDVAEIVDFTLYGVATSIGAYILAVNAHVAPPAVRIDNGPRRLIGL